jgi:4-hydroxy-tetrahydrodipicolinate synthase
MDPLELLSKIKGILHLVMTPFTQEDELDEKHLRLSLQDTMKKAKGKDLCFLAGGSTAEFYAMTDEEMKQYIDIVLDEVSGAFPVIMGTSRPGTKATIELSQYAETAGADGLMIVPPYYVPCTNDNIITHFKTVADSVKIGIVIYNNPATSKHWLTPATIGLLSKVPNIVGTKENIASPMSFYRVQKAVNPKDMIIFGSKFFTV